MKKIKILKNHMIKKHKNKNQKLNYLDKYEVLIIFKMFLKNNLFKVL